MQLLKDQERSQRAIKALIITPISLFIMISGFLLLKDNHFSQVATTLFAIVWGTVSVVSFFYSLNLIVQVFPLKYYNKIIPFVFVGPAILILGWYLFIPTLRSLYLSFLNRNSTAFVGLENYKYVFTDRTMLISFRNTILWLLFGTLFSVFFGLLAALLAERSSIEKIGKTFVFLPMAISMVGAGVIWKFMYAYKPAGANQTGLFNALMVAFGKDPQNWIGTAPMNNFFLIAIFVWLQTGFALVVLSAALKGVPNEIEEAARIDGASEFAVLMRIIIPSIAGSILTVATTILLAALKTFDIVFSMTNGLYGTEVLASQQYKQMFKFLNYGRGSAIAIIILLAVSPVIYYNLKEFNKREVF
ncbi:sugar ABC transporter permease [uncultured Sphaerochaeta sp.]|uniref:carbohydrate ABC transporter permease n=1 Tax=uncultured Sphaerochaeta sp. TaxID=886478 RepID=UPI002A0A130D|nr:sugar ABC transporter permease [uncultured Sphaerochaeta sp.]